MLVLAASLFFTEPVLSDLPKAEAYLVREDETVRLEDRFNRTDLWLSRTVVGCWEDADGRVFTVSRLSSAPPSVDTDACQTRVAYTAESVPMKRGKRIGREIPVAFRQALELLSPCPLAERGRPPRQLPRGYLDVDYWQEATNLSTIVCAFLPEKDRVWHLATWELAEGDNIYAQMGVFEDVFLAKEFARLPSPTNWTAKAGERELLRTDARHSIAAYPDWHATDAHEFSVLDHLSGSRGFIVSLTNDLAVMRTRYAQTLPTPIDGSNVLSVARIYANREEYLDAVGEDMAWSGACWCPERRELVAYLPSGGTDDLKRTIRHEAFHQYLSYATAMIPTSPWLNEGYAQYFEDVEAADFGSDFDLTPEGVDRLAKVLPGLFGMDYEQFYAGTDRERHLKYRLAWSIVRFLEKGADKVRFQPFKDLKRDYVQSLLRTQDMRKATAAAFGNEDRLRLFVAEWKKFWKK